MLLFGLLIGAAAYVFIRCVLGGIYTVEQNERAVITSFGRAQRLGNHTTLEDSIAEHLEDDHRERYNYPKVRVEMPGGP